MIDNTLSRETRASNLRTLGAFTVLKNKGMDLEHADKIAARFNRRFGDLARQTMTAAEKEELHARHMAGRKALYG
mgnify:FL=1